jgi:excisionase family DNA binding protein
MWAVEFARVSGYTKRHVRRLIAAGTIKATRIGNRGRWRISKDEVDRFLGADR